MFTASGGRRTADFATALRWHTEGELVLVDGWVRVARPGQEKMLKGCSFADVAKLHPKWKVETEVKATPLPEAKRLGWFVRHRQEIEAARAAKLEAGRQANKLAERLGLAPPAAVDRLALPPRKLKKAIRAGKIPRAPAGRHGVTFTRKQCEERMATMWRRFEALQERWRGAGKDAVVTLYHGTKIHNVEAILAEGFRLPYGYGMLGRGVYFGQKDKAATFSDGVILICEVMLGDCRELARIEKLEHCSNDSLHIRGGLQKGPWREEWVVRNPEQARVVGMVMKE